MYVNWESVLRVVPSTSEPKVCSFVPALESRVVYLSNSQLSEVVMSRGVYNLEKQFPRI